MSSQQPREPDVPISQMGCEQAQRSDARVLSRTKEVAEGWFINNGHNVFLNQMLRFSIPVGICFVLLFFGIVLYTTVKGRNFLIAGMWLAVLVLMNMDYALMSTQMALLFLIAYLVSIYNRKKPEKPRKIKEF